MEKHAGDGMTSKELVLRTLEFRNTEGRAPRQLWTLPWATEHHEAAGTGICLGL